MRFGLWIWRKDILQVRHEEDKPYKINHRHQTRNILEKKIIRSSENYLI